MADIGGPFYGRVGADLDWWRQRNVSVISWSAMEMLYNKRQVELYREDADLAPGSQAVTPAGDKSSDKQQQ